MIINTAGEYTLQYTATDACGNSTTVERDLVVMPPPRTVLYTDGTFIINERPQDIEANIQAHGQPTNIYDPFDPNGATDADKYIFASEGGRPWNSQASSVRSIEIGSNIQPTSTAYWFTYLSDVTSIDLSNLDTSFVTSMINMFYGCFSLTSLDVSRFNTSSVTDMSGMFRECKLLASLDVSGFNTASVTSMARMFSDCELLTTLDVSGFVTSSVTNMQYMFYNCYALTSLDLSNFNTSVVTNMSYMFSGCVAITSIDVSHFITSSVTDMQSMFFVCRLVKNLDLTSFDVSSVSNMRNMFGSCGALETVDLSSFDTSSLTDTYRMFKSCKALKTIYASVSFVTSQITSSNYMFDDMSSNLVGGAGTTWSSNNPKDKTYAIIDGTGGNPGYFTAKS